MVTISGGGLGSSISTGEIETGAVTDVKLAAGGIGSRIQICLIDPEVVTQGTWDFTINTSMYECGYFGNITSHANGDEVRYSVFLGAGTYTIKLIYMENANNGIVDIHIDAAEVMSVDTRNAVSSQNVVTKQTAIAIASSGIKTIRVVVDGTSGADYRLYLQAIEFIRTA